MRTVISVQTAAAVKRPAHCPQSIRQRKVPSAQYLVTSTRPCIVLGLAKCRWLLTGSQTLGDHSSPLGPIRRLASPITRVCRFLHRVACIGPTRMVSPIEASLFLRPSFPHAPPRALVRPMADLRVTYPAMSTLVHWSLSPSSSS